VKKLILIVVTLLVGCVTNQGATSSRGESVQRERARTHTELGAGYYAQNQMAVALDEFTEAIKIDPGYALAYNGLGLVYGTLREDAKADESFKKSISLEPGNSESHNNYGSFLCSRNRIDESIVQFLEAVKNPLYTTPGLAYMNAGFCSLRKQDAKNAEVYLRKALQEQPLLNQAAYQLSLIYFNNKQYKLAQTTLQNALVNQPGPEVLWLGIRLERLLGNKNAESSYALELRRRYPDSEQAKALISGQ
jgi:type IV pilus assembly protein PilF